MRCAAIAAVLALTAACGSTVQRRAGSTTDVGLGHLTVAGDNGATVDTNAGDGVDATGGATANGGAATANGSAATTVSRSAVPRTAGAVTGPIQVGFLTTAVSNAGAAGLSTGSSFTDREVYDALVAELNASGGLAGRKIVPVYGTTDTASSNWSSQFQAACTNLTQDHKVTAVLGYAFIFLDSFEQCLLKAGVPHLYGGYQPGDIQAQKEFPNVVSIANPTVDIAYITTFTGAMKTGLLTPATKLGVMIDDCAGGVRSFNASAAPFLKAHNITYDLVTGSCSTGSSDVTSASAAVSSAELRFASKGVQLVAAGGIPLLLFMAAAQSQGYHPQYVTSAGGAAFEPNAPAPQLANLHGFGWLPAVDVNPAHQPYPVTAAQQRCVSMLQRHGLTPKAYNDFLTAYITCDSLSLYALALTRTNGHTDATAIEQAVVAAMPSFQGASTYAGRLMSNATQRGGPAQYREWGWTPDCSCYTYRGPTYSIPTL
jgi:substrate-binding family protein